MRFDLRPLHGVGIVDFGMTRDAVRRTLNVPYEEFMKTPDATVPTDDFRSLDVHVYYDAGLLCKGVELWPGADLRVDGHEVLRRPWDEVKVWLGQAAPDVVVKDSLVLARSIGLSLYVPDIADESDAPVESAYAFRTWE